MNLSGLLKYWALQVFAPDKLLRHKYASFKELLAHDKKSLELITDLEDILHTRTPVDWARIVSLVRGLNWSVGSLIRSLASMRPGAYGELERRGLSLESSLREAVSLPEEDCSPPFTLTLEEAAWSDRLAGGKAEALSRALRETGLPGPQGFVVTTRAFQLFVAHNNLRHRLDELLAEVCLEDWERLEELSREMTAMVRDGEVPGEVQEDIYRRLAELQRQTEAGSFSLRSSAVGEDGPLSGAGQYASMLKVARADLMAAFKEVLASKYAPRAVAHRVRSGLADQETPMAVLVMEMIAARVSGVIYTRDREAGEELHEFLAVYAVPGLGLRLVDGSAAPEIHYFTREPHPRPVKSISGSACSAQLPGKNCLSPEIAALLAGWGRRLEELNRCPQDIEWCQDNRGACYLLQARPLVSDLTPHRPKKRELPSAEHSLLLDGGVSANAGVATGPVYVLRSEAEMGQVPHGSVLVSHTLSPSLAGIIRRLRAVVAEGGSRACHFASVAREFGVPVLAAAHEATKRLQSGSIVTVDACHGRVYRGEFTGFKEEEPPLLPTLKSPFAVRLQNIMELVSPLHLLDPASPDFSPEKCASMHDLVRFAHEQGMAEMFSLVGRGGRGLARARELATDLPLTLYILDLEGGVAPEAAEQKTIEPRFIASPLMRACWEGLTHAEVNWHKGLAYLDWERLDRISAGIMSLKSVALASYAVIGQDYLHLVLRFGYHFAVLDSLAGENPEANYIAFRFKGGGGSYENRLLRVEFIKTILEWAGFIVKTRGDLIDARCDRRPATQILARLTLLGILHGKTQLLDMALADEGQVQELVQTFKVNFGRYLDLEAFRQTPER
ncbi:MAG: PEP/pyruvate-binding domain-containing protein [Thermodesulfobacteriota bacterium]